MPINKIVLHVHVVAIYNSWSEHFKIHCNQTREMDWVRPHKTNYFSSNTTLFFGEKFLLEKSNKQVELTVEKLFSCPLI